MLITHLQVLCLGLGLSSTTFATFSIAESFDSRMEIHTFAFNFTVGFTHLVPAILAREALLGLEKRQYSCDAGYGIEPASKASLNKSNV